MGPSLKKVTSKFRDPYISIAQSSLIINSSLYYYSFYASERNPTFNSHYLLYIWLVIATYSVGILTGIYLHRYTNTKKITNIQVASYIVSLITLSCIAIGSLWLNEYPDKKEEKSWGIFSLLLPLIACGLRSATSATKLAKKNDKDTFFITAIFLGLFAFKLGTEQGLNCYSLAKLSLILLALEVINCSLFVAQIKSKHKMPGRLSEGRLSNNEYEEQFEQKNKEPIYGAQSSGYLQCDNVI